MYQKKAFDHIKKRKRNSEVDPVPEDIYIETDITIRYQVPEKC